MLTVTDPLGGVTTNAYDGNRNLSSGTNADNHTTVHAYDAVNRPIRTTRPDGSTSRTDYDAAGNVVAQIDGLNNATTYTYDALDRPIRMADPLGRATVYDYDKAGNVVRLIDQSNQTTTYAYDAANHLTGVTYSDGTTPNVTHGYDANGRRTTMKDGSGTSGFQWDSLNRLRVASVSDITVSYDYDLAGHITGIHYPNVVLPGPDDEPPVQQGTVTRGYDSAGRLASVTDWLGKTTRFTYDADGNLVREAFPNAVTTATTYDAAGRSTRITTTGPTGTLLDLPYTRTASGLVSSDNLTGTVVPVNAGYGYDADSRLTSLSVPRAPRPPPAAGGTTQPTT